MEYQARGGEELDVVYVDEARRALSARRVRRGKTRRRERVVYSCLSALLFRLPRSSTSMSTVKTREPVVEHGIEYWAKQPASYDGVLGATFKLPVLFFFRAATP